MAKPREAKLKRCSSCFPVYDREPTTVDDFVPCLYLNHVQWLNVPGDDSACGLQRVKAVQMLED
ncbi:MAG: hypothetical protein R6U98_06425 [Pirellulaceae bacterium]